MDIRIVDSTGKEDVTKPVEMNGPTQTPVIEGELGGQMELNAIGQMFDLKPSEISLFEDKIGTLLDFAKSQTDDHSIENLKWVIRDLQYKVGTPPLGEKFINYLSKYAYLKTEGNRIEKDLEKYEKNK